MYVAIEGLDGCGKSTLLERLVRRLNAVHVDFAVVEPTRASNPNSVLERWYASRATLRASRAFRALLYAVRSAYVAKRTDWARDLLLGDRSVVTSYVTNWGKLPGGIWTTRVWVQVFEPFIPAPDHVIFLDLPHDTQRARLLGRGSILDLDETAERSQEMRRAYAAVQTPGAIGRLTNTSWHVLDARGTPEQIEEAAWGILRTLVPALNRKSDAA